MLVPRYECHVSLSPDFLHTRYQANGVVVLVISDPFESSDSPSLEAIYNELKDRLFNFGGYLAG